MECNTKRMSGLNIRLNFFSFVYTFGFKSLTPFNKVRFPMENRKFVSAVNLLAAIFGHQRIRGFREKSDENTAIKNCVRPPPPLGGNKSQPLKVIPLFKLCPLKICYTRTLILK